MSVLFNNSVYKKDSLQKYIDESTNKSIQRKINTENGKKKTFLYVKNPIICELNYLKCDYDWKKEELFKYCKLTKEYLEKKKLDNNIFFPFCFYFICTSTFFILEHGSKF